MSSGLVPRYNAAMFRQNFPWISIGPWIGRKGHVARTLRISKTFESAEGHWESQHGGFCSRNPACTWVELGLDKVFWPDTYLGPCMKLHLVHWPESLLSEMGSRVCSFEVGYCMLYASCTMATYCVILPWPHIMEGRLKKLALDHRGTGVCKQHIVLFRQK